MSASASPACNSLPSSSGAALLAPNTPSASNLSTSASLSRYLDCLWQFCCTVSAVTSEDRRERVTRFHSAWEPATPLSDYIITIARRARYSRSTVLVALVLLSRYTQASNRMPSCLTVHRLLAVALLLAGKLYHDHILANPAFATAAGLTLEEVAQLEVAFASAMSFHLYVSLTEINELARHLDAAARKTLRGDITDAVSRALGVAPPQREPPESAAIVVSPLEAIPQVDITVEESIGDYSSSRVFGSFAVFTRGASWESGNHNSSSMETSGRRSLSMRTTSHLRGASRGLVSSRGLSHSSMASSGHRVTASSLISSPEAVTLPVGSDVAADVCPLPVFNSLFEPQSNSSILVPTTSSLFAPLPAPPPVPPAPPQTALTARVPSSSSTQHFRRQSFGHTNSSSNFAPNVPTLPPLPSRGSGRRVAS